MKKFGNVLLMIASILLIIFGIITGLLSLISMIGAIAAGQAGAQGGMIAFVVGLVILVITTVIYLVAGIVGVRAKKHPGASTTAFIFAILILISLIYNIATTSTWGISTYANVVIDVFYILGAVLVKFCKE